jgi:hypothetical protein
MEELRRERARASADVDARISDDPRPYAISGRPEATDRSSGLSPIMRRALQRGNPPPWAALSGGRQTVMLCA